MFELYKGFDIKKSEINGKKKSWASEKVYWLDFIQTFNEWKGANPKLTITAFMEQWHEKSLGTREAYKKWITPYWKVRETAVLRLIEARNPKTRLTDEKIIKELMQLGKINRNQAIKTLTKAKTLTIRNKQSGNIKLRHKTKYLSALKNRRNAAKKIMKKRRVI